MPRKVGPLGGWPRARQAAANIGKHIGKCSEYAERSFPLPTPFLCLEGYPYAPKILDNR